MNDGHSGASGAVCQGLAAALDTGPDPEQEGGRGLRIQFLHAKYADVIESLYAN